MIVESYEDVVILSGSLRSNFWETIHTAISLTLKRHSTGVVIDCSGITDITTDGAETFHDAIQFVKEHDRARIVLAAVPAHVMEVLRQVPEVRSQLPVVATVEDARKSLDLLLEGEDEHSKKKKAKTPTKTCDRTILAVISGDESDQHMFTVTEELVDTMPARVVLLCPIVIPRDLPLTAPMPKEESYAFDALEQGKKRMLERGTPCEVRLERTRDIPTLVQEIAQEVDAAHVIVGLASDMKGDDAYLRILKSVIDKVKTPLVIVRGKRD
jgi:anti-anti-sigma regulatory factor